MSLRLERRRDRPLVVVAEEDQRRLHHGREVRAFVEGAFAGRAVPEVRDRGGRRALELLAPGEAGGVRDVRRDRHADRGDPVLGRVPPAGRMPAPPVQDGARRKPAQEPDRRLAVAREDPVLVGERVHRAGLHRLVVPEDRVGADPALAVVDDRALVVRPQQDQRAVDREEVVGAEAFDLRSSSRTRRSSCSSRTTFATVAKPSPLPPAQRATCCYGASGCRRSCFPRMRSRRCCS